MGYTRRHLESVLKIPDRALAELEAGANWLSLPDLDGSEASRKNLYREMLVEYLETRDRNAAIEEQTSAVVREQAKELRRRAVGEARQRADYGALGCAPFVGLVAIVVAALLGVGSAAFLPVFCAVAVLSWWWIRRAGRSNAESNTPSASDFEQAAETAVENTPRYLELRRQRTNNPFPSVPREPTRYISAETKAEVIRRDGETCRHCGSGFGLEFDHITPHSRGGSNAAANVQLLCRPCNRTKGNRYSY